MLEKIEQGQGIHWTVSSLSGDSNPQLDTEKSDNGNYSSNCLVIGIIMAVSEYFYKFFLSRSLSVVSEIWPTSNRPIDLKFGRCT